MLFFKNLFQKFKFILFLFQQDLIFISKIYFKILFLFQKFISRSYFYFFISKIYFKIYFKFYFKIYFKKFISNFISKFIFQNFIQILFQNLFFKILFEKFINQKK